MPLIKPYQGKWPQIAEDAFIADNATIIGDVVIGPRANIWYGAVLRGDVGWIRIGEGTNVQDLACIHMTGGVSTSEIGAYVTIGHGAIIHGAKLGDGCLVGMGSVVLDNAEIGAEALVAAGSVVPPRMVVPPRHMVRGQPGKIVRELQEHELQTGKLSAYLYIDLAKEHRG
jgi:carbonic anhydrase/acetyltransferase-like protein (isoleucine patch superfamily)